MKRTNIFNLFLFICFVLLISLASQTNTSPMNDNHLFSERNSYSDNNQISKPTESIRDTYSHSLKDNPLNSINFPHRSELGIHPLEDEELIYMDQLESSYSLDRKEIEERDNELVIRTLSTQYTDHDPIKINGDADFRDQALLEGWLGNGTSSNPYIIEGLRIRGGMSSRELFVVTHTRLYFQLRGCLLYNNWDALYFNNVSNSYVYSNTFEDNRWCIRLYTLLVEYLSFFLNFFQ